MIEEFYFAPSKCFSLISNVKFTQGKCTKARKFVKYEFLVGTELFGTKSENTTKIHSAHCGPSGQVNRFWSVQV